MVINYEKICKGHRIEMRLLQKLLPIKVGRLFYEKGNHCGDKRTTTTGLTVFFCKALTKHYHICIWFFIEKTRHFHIMNSEVCQNIEISFLSEFGLIWNRYRNDDLQEAYFK